MCSCVYVYITSLLVTHPDTWHPAKQPFLGKNWDLNTGKNCTIRGGKFSLRSECILRTWNTRPNKQAPCVYNMNPPCPPFVFACVNERKGALLCFCYCFSLPGMWRCWCDNGFWDSVRLCAASGGEWLSKNLMKGQKKSSSRHISEAEELPWRALTPVFCARFTYKLFGLRDNRRPAFSPLSVSISSPIILVFQCHSFQPDLLWWCGAFTHIFTLFRPNRGAFSSPFSASTTPPAIYPPTSEKTSISVPCLFNISPLVGGCFIYRARDTCGDSLTERRCTMQQLESRGRGVTAGRSKVRKPLGCQWCRVCNVCVRAWVTVVVQRGQSKTTLQLAGQERLLQSHGSMGCERWAYWCEPRAATPPPSIPDGKMRSLQ